MLIHSLPTNPYYFRSTSKSVTGQEDRFLEVPFVVTDRQDRDYLEISGGGIFVEGIPVETESDCIRCLSQDKGIYRYFEIRLDRTRTNVICLMLAHADNETFTFFR